MTPIFVAYITHLLHTQMEEFPEHYFPAQIRQKQLLTSRQLTIDLQRQFYSSGQMVTKAWDERNEVLHNSAHYTFCIKVSENA